MLRRTAPMHPPPAQTAAQSGCRYCLRDTHASPDCHNAPTPSTDSGPVGVPVRRPQSGSATRDRGPSVEICRLFNVPGCPRGKYPYCRYAHPCKGQHPATECSATDKRRPSSGTQSHGPSVGPPATGHVGVAGTREHPHRFLACH